MFEIGNVRRFDNPRQLMAYLGLGSSESSTGAGEAFGLPMLATLELKGYSCMRRREGEGLSASFWSKKPHLVVLHNGFTRFRTY
ncbi:hypothetical protein ACIQUB_31280 [Rhizobium sp. NPDC090275]|uniref:hypothetical protein n=1 Tax=Rhizobium sp. NPDC090275 TaxID=3364498 RepID=UPI00383BF503